MYILLRYGSTAKRPCTAIFNVCCPNALSKFEQHRLVSRFSLWCHMLISIWSIFFHWQVICKVMCFKNMSVCSHMIKYWYNFSYDGELKASYRYIISIPSSHSWYIYVHTITMSSISGWLWVFSQTKLVVFRCVCSVWFSCEYKDDFLKKYIFQES